MAEKRFLLSCIFGYTASMTYTFNLPKTGKSATVEKLDMPHLAQILALLDATRAALPDTQKMFVLPQNAAYFQAFLDGSKGVMIGARCEGQLIAQMVVMGPLTLDDAIASNAITRNDVPFHHAQTTDTVVIAKSMAVHPDWRGNELSQHMVAMMETLPTTRAADHMFAQISAGNLRSWELFLRQGFGIVAAAIDPQDKQPRFILQKPISGFALETDTQVKDIDPIADFAAIVRLTGRESLIGQLNNGNESFNLAFASAAATGHLSLSASA